MRRYRFVLLAIILSLLLSTCAQFDPQWMGTWVDDTTVSMVTITLDFSEDYGTIIVDNEDPTAKTKKTIVKGTLTGDEYTLTATVTYIYLESNTSPPIIFESDEPYSIEAYLITLGLDGLKNSASYRIENNTITLKGKIISVLTGGPDELTAVKQ
jgi:hypothetical protein